MDDENTPRLSDRSLLVHLIGEMRDMKAEMQAHRLAFEEHTRSVRRGRVLGVLIAIMEWRATLIAGSALAAAYLKWPWRK